MPKTETCTTPLRVVEVRRDCSEPECLLSREKVRQFGYMLRRIVTSSRYDRCQAQVDALVAQRSGATHVSILSLCVACQYEYTSIDRCNPSGTYLDDSVLCTTPYRLQLHDLKVERSACRPAARFGHTHTHILRNPARPRLPSDAHCSSLHSASTHGVVLGLLCSACIGRRR